VIKKKRASCLVHGRHDFGYIVWCAEIEPFEKDGVLYDWVILAGFVPKKEKSPK
jgi:hypothetical protein